MSSEAAGLQAVFNRFLDDYRGHPALSPIQQKACRHIEQCRTEALGGLLQHCDHCDYKNPQYHSCRDRHCPKCQGRAQQVWCENQRQAVLPVTYYHLVFTLPHEVNAWISLHPEVIYRLLFQSVWKTLSAFGRDPKRLNGTLGMTCVLHTWGQTLYRHVHLHCLVPGGALTETGEFRLTKSNYLFPVKALSRRFRGVMVSALRQATRVGELHRITGLKEIDATLNQLMATDWVVYTKAYLKQPGTVVDYLGRYSRKTALNDRRIVGIEGDQVRLRYKDTRDNNRHKVMTLAGKELIRRFLLHILPQGFMRIRHFGFLANRCRQAKLAQIRACLEIVESVSEPVRVEGDGQYLDAGKSTLSPCPRCKSGRLIVRYEIAPRRIAYG